MKPQVRQSSSGPDAGETIVVTGAEGFIGSHLVEALVGRGAKVRALVQYNSFGSYGWLDSTELGPLDLEVVLGDIRDPDCCAALVEGARDLYHLASLIAVPYSFSAPVSYLSTNAGGTLNILNAARKEGIELFIHASTSEVYGGEPSGPISESAPLLARSPYAASKIAAEKYVESFHYSFGLPCSVIRMFNTFGPRQSTRAIIPSIICQLIDHPAYVEVGSLFPIRDMTYVQDVVNALVLATDRALPGKAEVVNIGSGVGVQMADLLATICRLMGVEPEVRASEHRVRPADSEVATLVCDNSRAAELLNWCPSVSFGDALRLTIGWFADESNRTRYVSSRFV